jgi:putative addiction module component (TIGR02574 family)
MSTQLTDILQMSVAERIQLAEDIWDSIAAIPEALPLTDAERQELNRRLELYARNTDEGIPWDELQEKTSRQGRMKIAQQFIAGDKAKKL